MLLILWKSAIVGSSYILKPNVGINGTYFVKDVISSYYYLYFSLDIFSVVNNFGVANVFVLLSLQVLQECERNATLTDPDIAEYRWRYLFIWALSLN